MCEQRLKKFPSIKSGDAKEIKRFAELLESSLIVLSVINHFGSLDSLDSLTMLVSKLPYDLRKSWVQKSVQIENSTGSLAKFTDFTNFVQVVSDEVNSLFGIRSLGIKTSKPLQRTKASAYSVSSANFTSKKPDRGLNLKIGICWFCSQFLSSSTKERFLFVKVNELCHKCFSTKHRTSECEKSDTCKVKGCAGKFHHTLLHYDKEVKNKSSNSQASNSSKSENIVVSTASYAGTDNSDPDLFLCVVPVIINCNGKEMKIYAFLDQGSTNTFCDKSPVDFFEIEGSYEKLCIQILNGITRNQHTVLCDLAIQDLTKQRQFVLPKVFVIDYIPVKPKTAWQRLMKPSYLNDVVLNSIPGGTVSILIDAEVPELFCMNRLKRGPPGTTIAVETPVGWSLLDLLYLHPTQLTFVTLISYNCSVVTISKN